MTPFCSIHKLLHWWIGLKACNVILARERLDRERKKKEENRKARAEAEFNGQNATGESSTPASFVALAPNSVFQSETGSRGSPISTTAMLTPPEAGDSPVAGPREGPGFASVNGGAAGENGIPRSSIPNEQQPAKVVEGVWDRLAARDTGGAQQASSHWAATNANASQSVDSKIAVQQQIAQANQAIVDKQISVEVAKLVASFRSDDAATEDVPQQNASIPYPGLDYDTLRALRALIYNEECSVQWDEEALLNRLERAWREGVRADSDKMIQNIPVFIARERAILTWIELRRHLAALDRADRRKFASFLHSQTIVQFRSLVISVLTNRQDGIPRAKARLRLRGVSNNTERLWAPHKVLSLISTTSGKASVLAMDSWLTEMSYCGKLSWSSRARSSQWKCVGTQLSSQESSAGWGKVSSPSAETKRKKEGVLCGMLRSAR